MKKPTDFELKIANRVFAPIMITIGIVALIGVAFRYWDCRSSCLEAGYSDWSLTGDRFVSQCSCFGRATQEP
ncbi:MAG: hypothetical protein AAF270_11305 [Pseudomonadota bacterium]